MKLSFFERAWDDYLYWQKTDSKTLDKINQLLKQTTRTPFEGEGKPEPMKHQLTGCWSRRINREHRLVYRVEDDVVYVIQCRFHYER
ncbi:MAG: Txe/YoeB family addiction module toxin [Verrucomicrobia bacterium]|nr:Txe/YoeB family addiction module toxin [Verrucomicrobiota bacterium]